MAKPRLRSKPGVAAFVDDNGMQAQVVGANGAATITTFPSTAHHAASMRTRDLSSWRPWGGSADSDLNPELPTLRSRSRDMERNNGVAHAGIQTVVDNVIGSGLHLIPRPDWRALKSTFGFATDDDARKWAKNWSAIVRSHWQAYAWTTSCDASDRLTFDQMCAQALRAELINGEAIGVSMWIPRRDLYASKTMTIESDRLSNSNNLFDTMQSRAGIKIGNYGEPIGYWIRNAHPGDTPSAASPYPAWEFVSRRYPSGRLRVFHAYDPQRSGQNRGKPILTPVLAQFKNVDRYTAAELQAAVVNAMVAGIIETPMAAEDVVALFQNNPQKYMQDRAANVVGLESGAIMALFPGDKFTSFLPQRPAAQFGVFVENILRIIACALDIPYELLLKDFSKTSYSSARAGMLEAWRSFSRRRDWFGTQWCDPMFANFLEELVNNNMIDAPDFYNMRAAYQRCKWLGPGRGAIDALKEAMAAQVRIESGTSTLEKECAELSGEDWEDIMEQRAIELDRADELGIPQIVSGRATIVPTSTDGNASNEPGVDTPPATDIPGSTPTQAQGDIVKFEYQMGADAAARQRAARRAGAHA